MSVVDIPFCTMKWSEDMINVVWKLLLLLVAITDIKKKKIPDYLVISGLFCGVFKMIFVGNPSFIWCLGGMIVSTAVFFAILLLAPGSFGGGDIKISGVIGFYLGPALWIESFAIAILTAGVFVLAMFATKKRNRKKEIAFGPFLCLGAMIAGW